MYNAIKAKLNMQKHTEAKGYMRPDMRFSTDELIMLLHVANILLSEDHMFDGFMEYLGLPKKKLKPLQKRLIKYNNYMNR